MMQGLLFVTWNPSPYFHFGSMSFSWYGLMFALAFFFGYVIMYFVFKKENVRLRIADWLLLFVLISMTIGARLGHVFFYEWDYYRQNPSEIFMLSKGGLASHGAAIAIALMLVVFAKIHKMNVWWLLDRIALVIPLGGALVRIGNLMNSEIFGKITSISWGFIFTANENAGLLPRHPVQLYEALAYLIIAVVLMIMYIKNKQSLYQGKLFGWMIFSIFFVRFLLEFFKEAQVASEKEMLLSLGQWLSIPFIIAGILIVIRAYNSKKLV
jgi:prolipoprotein diacylglyceryl transferase